MDRMQPVKTSQVVVFATTMLALLAPLFHLEKEEKEAAEEGKDDEKGADSLAFGGGPDQLLTRVFASVLAKGHGLSATVRTREMHLQRGANRFAREALDTIWKDGVELFVGEDAAQLEAGAGELHAGLKKLANAGHLHTCREKKRKKRHKNG